jgi:hypothetical protein
VKSNKKYNFKKIRFLLRVLNFFSKFLSEEILFQINNFKTLSSSYGQFKSINFKESIINKEPVPWFTYPAIEYIFQLDFREKRIFEFGSGNSTIFWSNRCKFLASVEDDKEWYEKILDKVPTDVDYIFAESKKEYIESVLKYSEKFDVIIIDGKFRWDCALNAIQMLDDEGFIILDNSDWHEQTANLFRENNLIEVDMSGFGPINNYTWTTSFFFSRKVKLSTLHKRQPTHPIGGIPHMEKK